MAKKETASRTNLDTMVRDRLRDAILTGEIADGAHLSEIKLSEAYGVSRTPVREALCALAADGLVAMYPNRGAFAKAPGDDTRRQLAEVYSLLMGWATRQSAQNMAQTDIARFEKAVAAMQSATSMEAFETLRAEANSLLRSTGATDVTESLLNQLEGRMVRPTLPLVSNTTQRAAIQQAYAFILSAIKRGQADVSEQAGRDAMLANLGLNAATLAEAAVGAA